MTLNLHIAILNFQPSGAPLVALSVHSNINLLFGFGDKQIRIEKNTDAIRISFQSSSLAPEDIEPEEFSFLGLKGDFNIFIDNATRIPIQVSSKIAVLGKVDIISHEVEISQIDS